MNRALSTSRVLVRQVVNPSRWSSTSTKPPFPPSPSTPPKQSTHRPGGHGEQLPIIPIIAILVGTSSLYVFIVKKKAAEGQVDVPDTPTTSRYRRNA